MSVFVDTSALFAVLDADDAFHGRVREVWFGFSGSKEHLVTTNYVLLETTALLQRRLGLPAVRNLIDDLKPVLDVVWVDPDIHEEAESSILAANRRGLSLVDATSFLVMRRKGLDRAFTTDNHFAEQGFKVIPKISSP